MAEFFFAARDPPPEELSKRRMASILFAVIWLCRQAGLTLPGNRDRLTKWSQEQARQGTPPGRTRKAN